MTVTDQSQARITFGLDAIDDQLTRLFHYLDRAEAEKREIETINLMVVKYTPVTFRQAVNGDDEQTEVAPHPADASDEELDGTGGRNRDGRGTGRRCCG